MTWITRNAFCRITSIGPAMAEPLTAGKPGDERLPDAEQLLAELARRMEGAIAFDARLIGIHSGGAARGT